MCGVFDHKTWLHEGKVSEGVHNSEDTVMYSLLISIGEICSVNEMWWLRRHDNSLRSSLEKNLESGFKAADCLFDNPVFLRSTESTSRDLFLTGILNVRLYYLSGLD